LIFLFEEGISMSKQNPWLWNIGSATIALMGTIATTAATATTAIAHGANITIQDVRAYEIEAVYDSGEPMVEAQVSVFGADNPQVPIETGVTDDQGRWVWIAEQPGTWTFQVRQAGHGGLAELEVLAQGEGVDLVSPEGANTDDRTSSQAFAAHQARGNATNPMPRWIAIGSIIWGAIGTALFFSRRSSASSPLS
jgi:nickel transport protein